ncbi:unnamed protein product [Diatraea saccharalis]|uniref:Uncharacterized protein n=1 Tax=Diatraea saccharalis TaxID=40085 RepID=A0A9N9RB21_9NEOP|nr:unnamed protein product [Diatraea saccharalis]
MKVIFFNRDVSSIYKRLGENVRLTAESIKINRGLTESEIAKDEANRASFTKVEDSYAGSSRHVRLRNGFENNGMAYIKLPIELREGNSHKSDDIVTKNARLMQKTDASTFKPVTVIKGGFSLNTETEPDNKVTFVDSNKKNQTIYRKTPQKTVSMPRNRISHTLSRTNVSLQNDSDSIYLESIKDTGKTLTQRIITDVTDEPIIEPVNEETRKKSVTEFIQNSTQLVVNSSEPENRVKPEKRVKPMNPNVSDLYNPVSDEEDRWIWGRTKEIETTTPDIENRVSFNGDSCPTGKVKIAGICIVPDTN